MRARWGVTTGLLALLCIQTSLNGWSQSPMSEQASPTRPLRLSPSNQPPEGQAPSSLNPGGPPVQPLGSPTRQGTAPSQPDLSATEGVTLAAQGITPALTGRVIGVGVIDPDVLGYTSRIQRELVKRPAPVPGMTRAAVEALWGPSVTSVLSPGKRTAYYTNTMELIEGRLMARNLTPKNIKVYEVAYSNPDNPYDPETPQTVTSVRPVLLPRVGDHANMFTLLLGKPLRNNDPNGSGVAYYNIPQFRVKQYRPYIQNPFDLVMVHTDAASRVVAQEFIPGMQTGPQYGFTSAQRYVQMPDMSSQATRPYY